eukprot:gb/GEZN01019911.1/.p1 GENE.gb/GEZN01019911.1/~~gb/GEZN01019911.1/.p1  ORF type:complete len:124 (+),score=5.96 gb/GEZN01019911.1/:174-545(+)
MLARTAPKVLGSRQAVKYLHSPEVCQLNSRLDRGVVGQQILAIQSQGIGAWTCDTGVGKFDPFHLDVCVRHVLFPNRSKTNGNPSKTNGKTHSYTAMCTGDVRPLLEIISSRSRTTNTEAGNH